MHKARLAYLLSIYFNKTATTAEVDELMEAVEDSRHDEALKSLLAELWEQHQGDHQPISEEKGKETLIAILQQGRVLKPARGNRRWWPAAAAAAVFALFVGSYYWMSDQMPVNEDVEEQSASYVIKPGGNKAILTLADGSHIELDSSREGKLTTQGGALVVNNRSSILAYGANKNGTGELVYNTLSTPRGGQYCLVLSDGTRVWLNANSSIRFPATFNGDTRSVSITGEAYFEVAKNKTKPFLVTAKEATISVLGTHFNIMAYEDENMMTTTLLEGAVKVSKGDRFKILKPGVQAQIFHDETIKTQIVDVDEEMAWKNGWFNFNSWDIQRIMRQISRWYDIDVVYEGKVPTGHYSGIVSRENNISQVLQIMKAGGVDFKIEDRKIIVSEGH
ncbi:FecR domain-containing protein [Chitinophaga niabensis]|uniref:FecR family protein n=1 Tax=Chitinophaga niabensis TaxID=536979 RepID=UPI0031BB81E5